jgi:ribosomal protein L9
VKPERADGIELDKKKIILEAPIKNTGEKV